jgi:hypothetical protein
MNALWTLIDHVNFVRSQMRAPATEMIKILSFSKYIGKALKESGDFFDVFDVSEHPPLFSMSEIEPRGRSTCHILIGPRGRSTCQFLIEPRGRSTCHILIGPRGTSRSQL